MAFAATALTPQQQAVVNGISENSLRGNLSFLSSDLLEGRDTPSRGLDLAAEYIAAQFRRAGLEPVGGDGYFQDAKFKDQVVRNVAGLLRGSDPALADTYVILSAHYDHLGIRPNGDDRIYNGANDDGSGTVSVIEIASALAAAPERPKRSILFLAFFGEEKGLLGSRYYAAHPLEPLDKTIADVNLEQVGRTDSTNGKQIGVEYVTGFDYSNLGAILNEAAQPTGIPIKQDLPSKGDFFARSDNLSLARAGVVSHTIYVADDYSDYHKVGDEWQKIDYANMAKVDRAIALGLLRLASDAAPPLWNQSSSAARPYAAAAKKLHP
ncbi:MAG TPA: M20/M25/M40 family metallo-hydrolase [Bryobacteraceae bacterium]